MRAGSGSLRSLSMDRRLGSNAGRTTPSDDPDARGGLGRDVGRASYARRATRDPWPALVGVAGDLRKPGKRRRLT